MPVEGYAMNGQDPAFPMKEGGIFQTQYPGISKREWYAGMAMMGLCANPNLSEATSVAICAWAVADAMLAKEGK